MQDLRTPFFVVAVILFALALMLEEGSLALPPGTADLQSAIGSVCGHGSDCGDTNRLMDQMSQEQGKGSPGLGIPYLGLIDVMVLFVLILIALNLVLSQELVARLQGCAGCLLSLMVIVGGIALIFTALGLVILMVSLLLAVPFGTLAYLAAWGFFNTGAATVVLTSSLILKVVCAICLVIAQQRFLVNKSLVLLLLLSIVADIVVSFLQNFPPGFLASITDAIAAIVVGILGVIVAVVLGIGSLASLGRALKPTA
jgi:hypothetical protein